VRRARGSQAGGPSGLSAIHRSAARRRAVQAALLGLAHRGVIHYTQGGSRWQGIDRNRQSKNGQYPNWCDCSSFTTWCLWNALKVAYGVRDVVNGQSWRAGFTGTQLSNGISVSARSMLPGDLVIYRGHVAIYVGNGKVVSHGSEAGPVLVPWNYRGDVVSIRRYI
jgi:cell wall-associated NlpC family hydrolase